MALRHASLCRYTAGVYSHIPGAMAALPKFDEGSDFKIPANVVKGDLDPWMWSLHTSQLLLLLPCLRL